MLNRQSRMCSQDGTPRMIINPLVGIGPVAVPATCLLRLELDMGRPFQLSRFELTILERALSLSLRKKPE